MKVLEPWDQFVPRFHYPLLVKVLGPLQQVPILQEQPQVPCDWWCHRCRCFGSCSAWLESAAFFESLFSVLASMFAFGARPMDVSEEQRRLRTGVYIQFHYRYSSRNAQWSIGGVHHHQGKLLSCCQQCCLILQRKTIPQFH